MSQPIDVRAGAKAARTPAQIEASRRNGARSRGPRTAEGKARSAANSRRHGLCSAQLMLRGEEERRAFAALLADLEGRLAPEGETERHLVEELATIAWRQRMLRTVEARALEALAGGEPAPGLPTLATLCRYRARLDRDRRRTLEALEELQEQRRRLSGAARMANPAQLRWLAALIERRQDGEGTNEPEPVPPFRDRDAGMNEPGPARARARSPRPAVATASTAGPAEAALP